MTTTPTQLEERVALLEDEVAQLKGAMQSSRSTEKWWHKLTGKYADNPDFEEAMRLGREYRASQKDDE